MLFKMSEEQKPSTVEPIVVIADNNNSPVTARKMHVSKKAVVVTVSCMTIVGLVVTGLLVGIRLYFTGRTEELKFFIQANGISENITTSNNVVTHHVKVDEVQAWVVQDFNKELQTIKVQQSNIVGCIVTILNRSVAITPAAVSFLAQHPTNYSAPTAQLKYEISSEEIGDITFLGREAGELCKNIPTYHAVRTCKNEPPAPAGVVARPKRQIVIRICFFLGCITVVLG